MTKKTQQTFTNGHNEEHYKIIVVGGGLVNYHLSYLRIFHHIIRYELFLLRLSEFLANFHQENVKKKS